MKQSNITLTLVDGTVRIPEGIVKDVMVVTNQVIFPSIFFASHFCVVYSIAQ